MNWFWCQLAQVVHGARPWMGQLCGSGGQRSRSHKAKVRYGCLAEASLSTPWGQVALLVLINLCCYIDIFATKAIFCWNLCFFSDWAMFVVCSSMASQKWVLSHLVPTISTYIGCRMRWRLAAGTWMHCSFRPGNTSHCLKNTFPPAGAL